RRLERHEAEIEEEQDQLRSQARVPYPPSAPGGLSPEGASPEREKRKERAGGRNRARHHAREPGVERETESRPERHAQVEEPRHPGCRNVDEDDAIGLALLGVGGCAEKTDV